MGRILIFVDDDVNKGGDDPINYYGLGLGSDIVTVSSYLSEDLTDQDRREIIKLENGDRALLVGKGAWDEFCKVYHNGLRSENGFDASQLTRLGLNNGAFVKVLWKDKDYGMDKFDVNYFLSDDFVKMYDFSHFKQVVVSDYRSAIKFLAYFDSLNCEFGYDFETSGMPTVPDFKITGCSICTVNYGAFFSFTDIRRNSTDEEWKSFLDKFALFSYNHQSDIWTYNLQFEQHVNLRSFGLDLELCDSSVYNIIEGFHSKKYSLKWTVQRVLLFSSYDDDFDYLNHTLNRMYWREVPDPDNSKQMIRVPNCTIDTFEDTPEFDEVCKRYPNYIDEFKLLIRENFGNTFCNIPSQILGYYCNLDAYSTLMIREVLKNKYSKTCVDVYLDNLRLGARLHAGGIYKDVEYHARYQDECNKMMAYGITYSATVYCKLKLDDLKNKSNDINEYNESCRILLARGEFMEGDMTKFAKKAILDNLSDMYDSGLDEPSIYDKYGEVIYSALVEGLKDANCKADPSIGRKRKPFTFIVKRLNDSLGIDHIHLGEKHKCLEEYMYYKSAYDNFLEIWRNQMTDIYNIPYEFIFLGVRYNIRDYIDKVKKEYFPCTSPKEYGVILEFLMDKYKLESSFLSMIYNNLNKVDIKHLFDSMYSGMNINQAYDHYLKNIGSYPKVLQEIALGYLNDPYGERMTDTFDDGRGFRKA